MEGNDNSIQKVCENSRAVFVDLSFVYCMILSKIPAIILGFRFYFFFFCGCYSCCSIQNDETAKHGDIWMADFSFVVYVSVFLSFFLSTVF